MKWNRFTKKELIHICDGVIGKDKIETALAQTIAYQKALNKAHNPSIPCYDCVSIALKLKEIANGK